MTAAGSSPRQPRSAARAAGSAALARIRSGLTSPVARTDLLQVVKSTLAAVLAWVLADTVFGLPQAFLAAWVGLLTVHATVYRTLWRGLETVVAVAVGVILAFVVVELWTVSPWSLALAVLVALLLARVPGIRTEGITVATTVLIVLTEAVGSSEEQTVSLLPDRLLDTLIGVVVAFAINLVVVPPLNDASAQRQVDDADRRLGELLVDMADTMRDRAALEDEDDWIDRTRSVDADLDAAWSLVRRSQESRRYNPRRRRRGDRPASYSEVLERLEEGVAQARSIARFVRESSHEVEEWDPRFRSRFVELLADVGHRVADPDADLGELRDNLGALVESLSTADLPDDRWPLYGALLSSLRIIIDVTDDVATARPVRT